MGSHLTITDRTTDRVFAEFSGQRDWNGLRVHTVELGFTLPGSTWTGTDIPSGDLSAVISGDALLYFDTPSTSEFGIWLGVDLHSVDRVPAPSTLLLALIGVGVPRI
jgi:hypothetical protein